MKRYIPAIIGLIGAVVAALIVSGVLFPNRKLEIRVYDMNTQKTIDNATVKIGNDTKPTGSDGIVVFSNLSRGYQNFTISKKDYEEFAGTTKIEGKENLQKAEIKPIGDNSPLIPSITFTEPQDESVQISPVSLTGTSKNLTQNSHFWVVVNPHGSNGWWPQTREIMIKPNGKWSGVALLGGDKGQKFDIHFILADNQAHNEFNEYLSECTESGKYPGKPLPSGSNSLGYITITKK